MSYYLIRVGQGSKYIDEAKRGGFVAIDFDEVPDLDNFSNFDDLKTFLKNKYNYSSAQLGAQAGQIIRFGYEMENFANNTHEYHTREYLRAPVKHLYMPALYTQNQPQIVKDIDNTLRKD